MDITTERLWIRDIEETDFDGLYAFRSDPDAVRYMDFGPDAPAETHAWITATIPHNQAHPRQSHNASILLRETGEVIGWIGIGRSSRIEIEDHNFGYGLARPFWGNGYMTEAVKALLKFAFTALDAEIVFAECYVPNTGSANVMRKAGMQFVGRFPTEQPNSPEKAEFLRFIAHRREYV